MIISIGSKPIIDLIEGTPWVPVGENREKNRCRQLDIWDGVSHGGDDVLQHVSLNFRPTLTGVGTRPEFVLDAPCCSSATHG